MLVRVRRSHHHAPCIAGGDAPTFAGTSNFTSEAKELDPQQAVRELRAYASSIAASDTGFARDLFAAAERYEFGDSA